MIFDSRHERFIPEVPTSQLSLDMEQEQVATRKVYSTTKISYTRSHVTAQQLNHPGRS